MIVLVKYTDVDYDVRCKRRSRPHILRDRFLAMQRGLYGRAARRTNGSRTATLPYCAFRSSPIVMRTDDVEVHGRSFRMRSSTQPGEKCCSLSPTWPSAISSSLYSVRCTTAALTVSWRALRGCSIRSPSTFLHVATPTRLSDCALLQHFTSSLSRTISLPPQFCTSTYIWPSLSVNTLSYGLSVHLKIYPIIYSITFMLFLSGLSGSSLRTVISSTLAHTFIF